MSANKRRRSVKKKSPRAPARRRASSIPQEDRVRIAPELYAGWGSAPAAPDFIAYSTRGPSVYEFTSASKPLTEYIAASNLAFLPNKLGSPDSAQLEREIEQLRSAVDDRMRAWRREKQNRRQKEEKLRTLRREYGKLQHRVELAFLLNRVTPLSHKALRNTAALRAKFLVQKKQVAFVLAIDIRRSTELMLKARTPELFAKFMTMLCNDLEVIIKQHFGVFDKFTGDGILAFFPEFFTGPDAGYHAIIAADEARTVFAQRYKQNRSSFTTVLNDVQLVTGIDYGAVHLVRVADGLTVVGTPVVYACRLSGGKSGEILLNQPAYEEISKKYSDLCFLAEQTLEIKHEGNILCYRVDPNTVPFTPKPPSWLRG